MQNKFNILIIEDDQSRVEWLKDTFDKQFNICWHTNVKDFVRDYTFSGIKWDLVIFDYDLTPDYATPIFDQEKGLWLVPTIGSDMYIPWDKDKDNYNGLDAAMFIPEAERYDKEQLFLIWSGNPTGAYKILKCLKQKGYSKIIEHRFDFYTCPNLKTKIKLSLGI